MTEELSRSSKRKKKKPKKSKKPIFVVFFLILILVGAGGLYWFINKEQSEKIFKEKQLALTKTIQQEMKETGIPLNETKEEDSNFKKLYYFPSDEDALNKELKNEVMKLVDQTEEKAQGEKGTLVGNIQVHPITDQLSSIKPLVTSYFWSNKKRDFIKKEYSSEEVAYINQSTQKPVTAKDLFPEKSNLLSLDQLIQQKILDNSKDGKKIIDAVLAFPRLTWDNFTFVYNSDKFIITPPKNKLNIEELSFAIKDVGDFMNAAFVDPTKLEDKKLTFDPNKKYICITFDDGPGPETTPQLLKILKEKDIKTTFFNLGENATEFPDVVKQIVNDGHEIANHSFTHPPLNTLSKEQVEKEINNTNKAIYLATGKLPKKVRPPYGAIDLQSADVAGAPIMQWNIDSNDWSLKDAAKIRKNVVSNAFNGGIILLHDIHQFSVDAVPGIIDDLKADGYTFITLDEMLGITKPLYQYFGLYQGEVDAREIEQ